jgi:hypothetical protein
MKNLLKAIIVLLLIVSCRFEAKKVNDDLLHENEQMEKLEMSINKWEKIENNLSKKTPLSDDELLQAFPKNLMGTPLDKVDVYPGMNQVYGTFGNGKISLSIADAAGNKSGLAISFYTFFSYVPPASEKSKLIKIERDGVKTITDYKHNVTEIRLLLDNRYIVNLSAKMMNPEEVWQTFDIKDLNGYKEKNR